MNDAQRAGLIRIIDAEANRAAEGLRTIEDYVRFFLDDRHLTEAVKRLRHDLVAALSPIELSERLAMRESQHDVGASLSLPSTASRRDAADVVTASMKRVQQAFRSIEEYAKVIDQAIASRVEPLRFRLYTLERAVANTAAARSRLAEARLYVLLDAQPNETAFCRLVETLVAAGVDVLQLREKHLDDRQLLARARKLRQLVRGSQTLFIMNDRPDLAVLSDADGVHVGQEELETKDVRRLMAAGRLVGVSTHSIEQARQAVLDGADYIGVGPTFPSQTKSFHDFAGLELVRSVATEISLPAFAIGGINAANVRKVIEAGLPRVALSGAATKASDPGAAVKELKQILAEAKLAGGT